MHTTSTLSIATLLLAGLFTTGCSQQQIAGSAIQHDPAVATEATKAPVADANSHTHPAQPNCTDSVTHTHPNGANSHNHRYSCHGMKKATGNKWTHRHAAIPRCTDSVNHTHKFNNRGHHHKYTCR